ncbi:unnamed protein product [Closterium sp. NIES-54]
MRALAEAFVSPEAEVAWEKLARVVADALCASLGVAQLPLDAITASQLSSSPTRLLAPSPPPLAPAAALGFANQRQPLGAGVAGVSRSESGSGNESEWEERERRATAAEAVARRKRLWLLLGAAFGRMGGSVVLKVRVVLAALAVLLAALGLALNRVLVDAATRFRRLTSHWLPSQDNPAANQPAYTTQSRQISRAAGGSESGSGKKAGAMGTEGGGMVRADLLDLSTMDALAGGEGAAAKGKADGGAAEKAEGGMGKAAAKVADESGGAAPWTLDMSKVMCTNQLAAGAFGKVFHGLYEGDDVAVKLLNVPADMAPKDLEGLKSSFMQEIKVWHTLSHPNVVQFIGASLNAANIRAPSDAKPPPGQPLWAIVTEYMGGGTLRAHLARRGKLPPKESVRLALHIARGLCYLHARDVVHRDLKSDNLLLDHKGTVKIADFGVARTEAKNPNDMTCETGTVRWMAPEVIDHKPYTRRVDVYSFGIVLWELVTSDLPFKGLTFIQLAFNVVNKVGGTWAGGAEHEYWECWDAVASLLFPSSSLVSPHPVLSPIPPSLPWSPPLQQNMRPEVPAGCEPELAALMVECWDADADKRPEFMQVVARLEALQQGMGGTMDVQGGCCTLL